MQTNKPVQPSKNPTSGTCGTTGGMDKTSGSCTTGSEWKKTSFKDNGSCGSKDKGKGGSCS